MKQGSLMWSALMAAGCWLAAGVAWADSPPLPVPATGGLPQCEAELAECTINLTDTEGMLQVCEDALAQCQATEGQAFPATGQTSCWYYDDTNLQYVEDPECTNLLSAGQDGDIQAGAELSDTGLTIIDNNTKLEWMKQDFNSFGCNN